MADRTSFKSPVGGPAKRVVETGIALVHEGEVVLPAAGSEAQATRVMDDARQEIHYHFPVEIIVHGTEAAPVEPEAGAILAELRDHLRNLA
ncbi:MAG: hypothetical protein U1F43_34160 [Myxococcota bacterium]